MLASLTYEAFDLNLLDFVKEKTMALCILMERAAAGIMAQHNVKNYDVHQAVLDFTALEPDKVMWVAGAKTM